MSFQAYLDNIEEKTGKTPREFIAMAEKRGFTDPETKAGDILAWLKTEFGLGRGHGMAIVHIIKHGEEISDQHVNSSGAHSDPSNRLDLAGKRNRKR
jgi:hypothetical protein